MVISKLAVAVLLVGIWLIIASQEPVGETLTLIFGIAVVVLALFDSVVALSRRA